MSDTPPEPATCGTPFWDFHVYGERISPNRVRLVITSKSGITILREGHIAMWELIRAMGTLKSNTTTVNSGAAQ